MVVPDTNYTSKAAVRMDAAYQGLIRGVIPVSSNCLRPSDLYEIGSVSDNYRFVRKYFAIHWYAYVLFIRLLTFNNPLNEIWFFLKNLSVNRVDLYSNRPKQPAINTVLKDSPFVSIIIPTLNRYEYLKDVLTDLENQTYKHFEVLVCDQSDNFDDDFYSHWRLDLSVIRQQEKALWLARNTCICKAKGEYILMFDDDSRVQPDWITEHLKCISYFGVDISAGVTNTLVGHGLSPKEHYYHLSDVFDTGNALVKRSVFEQTGLFDRQFERQRMGDGEFGLRAILKGFQIVSNPYARRIHLKVETGGLRQLGSWDALRPSSFMAPRPIPSVLYFYRRYFGNESAIYFLIQNIPQSFIPYRLKKSKLLKLIAMITSPFLLPVMIISVARSWKESGKKLREGPLTGTLIEH